MSELPPPRVRGQRSGTCKTCKAAGRRGAIRYYPRPGAAAGEPAGAWSHMVRSDWTEDPHDPVPDEDEEG